MIVICQKQVEPNYRTITTIKHEQVTVDKPDNVGTITKLKQVLVIVYTPKTSDIGQAKYIS